MIVIGLAFFALGIFINRKALLMIDRCTNRTQGNIMEYVVYYVENTSTGDQDAETPEIYSPLYTYDVLGKSYANTSSSQYTKKPFETGASVTVLYDPDDPSISRLESEPPEKPKKNTSVFLCGTGLVLLGLIIILFL